MKQIDGLTPRFLVNGIFSPEWPFSRTGELLESLEFSWTHGLRWRNGTFVYLGAKWPHEQGEMYVIFLKVPCKEHLGHDSYTSQNLTWISAHEPHRKGDLSFRNHRVQGFLPLEVKVFIAGLMKGNACLISHQKGLILRRYVMGRGGWLAVS